MADLNPNDYPAHRLNIQTSDGVARTYYIDELGLLDMQQAMASADWDAEDATFTWDAAGNMKSNSGRGISNIDYDTRNLPVRMDLSDGLNASYTYNSSGWRIHKRIEDNGTPSVDEHYIMDGGTLLAVTDSTGSVQFWNMYGRGLIGRMESGGTRKYYLRDHLGSTRTVVDGAGTVLEAYDYYPYGLILRSYMTGEWAKETFTGKEQDQESGTYYFGARYYDPVLAGWLATDPAGQFHSPYVYAGNNPVAYIDADGNLAWFVPIIIGAVANVGFQAASGNIDNFGEALGFAAVGGLGGAMSMIGNPGAWYGLQNVLVGSLQGGLTQGLNNAVAGERFWNGVASGAAIGGAFGLVTSEQFGNTLKGEGWRSNQQVLDRFLAEGNYTGALEHFGFDRGVEVVDWDLGNDASFWYNTRDPSKYGMRISKSAFESYDILKQSYYKELYHMNKFEKFGRAGFTLGDIGIFEIDRWPEERLGAIFQYKNQGLYPNSTSLHYQIIKNTEQRLIDFGFSFQPYQRKWWHFIYKIPRRYGTF